VFVGCRPEIGFLPLFPHQVRIANRDPVNALRLLSCVFLTMSTSRIGTELHGSNRGGIASENLTGGFAIWDGTTSIRERSGPVNFSDGKWPSRKRANERN
jgi:hypothetical protein